MRSAPVEEETDEVRILDGATEGPADRILRCFRIRAPDRRLCRIPDEFYPRIES